MSTPLSTRIRAIRQVPSWQITLGVALLVLGFLIAAQLRAEAPRVRYASTERIPLLETAQGLQKQQDALKQQLGADRQKIQDLESAGQGSAALVQDLNGRLQTARIAAGLVAVHGPGLALQLEDSTKTVLSTDNPSDYAVSARDVRTLVDELWLAGAEAIAVNGERVTAATSIEDIGGTVLVNAAYLAPPYQVTAIGPPGLFDTLNASAGFRDFVRARVESFGIQVRFAELKDVTIPAYAGTVNTRFIRPLTPSASASP